MSTNAVSVGENTSNVQDIEEIHEFGPLHEWESNGVQGKLIARVIRVRNRTFLDVREHQTGPEFTGYTRRGLRLSAHEIHILEAYIFPTAKTMLRNSARKPNALAGDQSSCKTSNATDAAEVTPNA